MKYCVIGNGKTGSCVVDLLSLEDNHIFNLSNPITLEKLKLYNVAFVFVPTNSFQDIEDILIDSEVDLVIGTTNIDFEKYRNRVTKAKWIISSNFSLLVQLFFRLLKESAGYIKDMDKTIYESHYITKQDFPSGTSITASEILGIKKEDIKSTRSPYNMDCIHDIIFQSDYEELKISHIGKNRMTYAKGAYYASQLLENLDFGIYEFADLL